MKAEDIGTGDSTKFDFWLGPPKMDQVFDPRPFQLANIKAIVVLAPGKESNRFWRGHETSNAWHSRLGYLPDNPAKLLQWKLHEPGDCCLCGRTAAMVYWRGPRTEKTAKVPESIHTRIDKTVIGPREGPSECRVLLCRTCYMKYGARLAIATYPPMDKTSCVKCECKWDGEVLHKCPDHLDVVVQCGHHVNRGEGSLLEPTEQVTQFTLKEQDMKSHDSLEDLNPSVRTELDALIEASFPIPDASRPNIKLFSRAPEMVRLADTQSRANVITDECSKGKAIDMSVQDVVKAMIRARSHISQRAKAEAFMSGYSSNMCHDWYTNCTPFKSVQEKEVLIWEVLAAPIPMLAKPTEEEYVVDNVGMISVFSWVKIRIHLDLTRVGAVKAMAVSFSHDNKTADPMTARVEPIQGNHRPAASDSQKRKLSAIDIDSATGSNIPGDTRGKAFNNKKTAQTAKPGKNLERDKRSAKVACTAEVLNMQNCLAIYADIANGSTTPGDVKQERLNTDLTAETSEPQEGLRNGPSAMVAPSAETQIKTKFSAIDNNTPGESLERDEPPAKVACTAEVQAKLRGSTDTGSASGTQMKGDVVKEESANRQTADLQTSDHGKSLESNEPSAKVARTADVVVTTPTVDTDITNRSKTRNIKNKRLNTQTAQAHTLIPGKSLESNEPPAKVACTADVVTKPNWLTVDTCIAIRSKTLGDIMEKPVEQAHTLMPGKSVESDEPSAKVARTVEVLTKGNWSTVDTDDMGGSNTHRDVREEKVNTPTAQSLKPSLEVDDEPCAMTGPQPGWSPVPYFKEKNPRIQLYDECGWRFQNHVLFNPTVWQRIAYVRRGRVPRHDPFMSWDGHRLTKIMAESKLLAVTSINVRPQLLRRRTPSECDKEETQVAVYQSRTLTWAVISALGKREGQWCPPSIVAILAVPGHPKQWMLFRGVKERGRWQSDTWPSSNELPMEGVKGPEPCHGDRDYRSNHMEHPCQPGFSSVNHADTWVPETYASVDHADTWVPETYASVDHADTWVPETYASVDHADTWVPETYASVDHAGTWGPETCATDHYPEPPYEHY